MYLQLLLSPTQKPVQRKSRQKSIQEEDQRSRPQHARDSHTLCGVGSVSRSHCLKQGGKDAGSDHGDAVADVGGVGGRGTSRGSGSASRRVLGSRSRRGLGGRRASTGSGVGRGSADIGVIGVDGAALVLDVGLARVLALRALGVGSDAVGEGSLADELWTG
jgi:hypothetical protein